MAGTTTDQIREKLDIVQFLRGYLELRPAGKNFKANCPFHKEKTPSFMVSPERQTWHCFGCNIGGDIFSFLMRHENIEFGEALRILAEKSGVELRRVNPAEYKLIGLLHELNAAAKQFFKDELKAAPLAQKYLAERGLSADTIEEFEVGFAPNQTEALTVHLLKLRYAPEDIVRAGLAIQTERGARIDRFRGRIMFPIHDHFGKPVGFTGRIMPEFATEEGMGSAKYVNSPETPVFNKSKILYGYHLSKNHIREAGWAFLVEGQMDLLMSWQAGVRNVAASSGTALTADHLRTLRRTTDRLKVCFDMDEAGTDAAERGIDLAEASDFSVEVVRLDGYKDPAEAVQGGEGVLQKAITGAIPAPEFYFEKYLVPESSTKGVPSRYDRRDRSYLKSVRAVLVKLKNLSSAVDRDYWMKELSKRTGIGESALREEADRIETRPMAAIPAAEAPAEPERNLQTRRELLSERLLAACFARSDFGVLGAHVEYLAPDYRLMHEMLSRGERRSTDPRLDELLNLVALRSEETADAEFASLKEHIFSEYLKERRKELVREIKRTEEAGDAAALAAALGEINRLPVM